MENWSIITAENINILHTNLIKHIYFDEDIERICGLSKLGVYFDYERVVNVGIICGRYILDDNNYIFFKLERH